MIAEKHARRGWLGGRRHIRCTICGRLLYSTASQVRMICAFCQTAIVNGELKRLLAMPATMENVAALMWIKDLLASAKIPRCIACGVPLPDNTYNPYRLCKWCHQDLNNLYRLEREDLRE